LIFDTDLILSTPRRLEGHAVKIGAACGLEGLSVAEVRRQADVEEVDKTGPPRQGTVGLGGRGIVQSVSGVAIGPIVTPAEQQDPWPQFALVLEVEPDLVLRLMCVSGGVRTRDRLVIDWAEQIQRRRRPKPESPVPYRSLVIEAEQQGVLERAGIEFRLALVIKGDRIEMLPIKECPTVDRAEVRLEPV
jgi:hypothetical protein